MMAQSNVSSGRNTPRAMMSGFQMTSIDLTPCQTVTVHPPCATVQCAPSSTVHPQTHRLVPPAPIVIPPPWGWGD